MKKAHINDLYYGDNLKVIRESVKTETVDLIYLDPPFNSDQNYNQLFKLKNGKVPYAHIKAFEDTWSWSEQAQEELNELILSKTVSRSVKETIAALEKILGHNDMLAYLVFMTTRLIEMHRVLKKTGLIFLHCDSTASHYIKIVLDAIFKVSNYRTEMIWKRTNSPKSQSKFFGIQHDVIFMYSKSKAYKYKVQYHTLSQGEIDKIDKGEVKKSTVPLVAAGAQRSATRKSFKFQGITDQWLYSLENLQKMWDAKLIYKTANGKLRGIQKPETKYRGAPISNLWVDIQVSPVQGGSEENLGYPTQKPRALVERILQACTDEGDLVMDPFCGCGTSIHAASNLKRNWIGIDITHLAINTIETRLADYFDKNVVPFKVHGIPEDLETARKMATSNGLDGRYEFQWWATALVGATPFENEKKKGKDGGVDGIKNFIVPTGNGKTEQICEAVVSVKSDKVIIPAYVDQLANVVKRRNAEMGILLTLEKPSKGVLETARSCGFFTDPFTGNHYQKIQVLWVEDLMKKTGEFKYPRYGSYVASKLPVQTQQGLEF